MSARPIMNPNSGLMLAAAAALTPAGSVFYGAPRDSCGRVLKIKLEWDQSAEWLPRFQVPGQMRVLNQRQKRKARRARWAGGDRKAFA